MVSFSPGLLRSGMLPLISPLQCRNPFTQSHSVVTLICAGNDVGRHRDKGCPEPDSTSVALSSA
jgi:hypothetical protein